MGVDVHAMLVAVQSVKPYLPRAVELCREAQKEGHSDIVVIFRDHMSDCGHMGMEIIVVERQTAIDTLSVTPDYAEIVARLRRSPAEAGSVYCVCLVEDVVGCFSIYFSELADAADAPPVSPRKESDPSWN